MSIFLTADLHLGHANIIKYCQRPFNSVDDMGYTLVTNWNRVVDKNDTVFHIGDFCFSSKKRPATYWIRLLNGNIVFLAGNHDKPKDLPYHIDELFLNIRGERFYLTHDAPYSLLFDIHRDAVGVCTAHCHDSWKAKIVNNIPIINVGCDVWEYTPVEVSEFYKYFCDVRKNKVIKR